MSGSILSWDDFEEDENPAVVKAAQALKQLDTSEAEKEFQAQEEAIAKRKALQESGLVPAGAASTPLLNPGANYTPAQLKGLSENLFAKAREAIKEMDKHLETGGRVEVGDKYVLNAKSDLNQLVPFKYPWAWSLYLTSTEHHWMPAEMLLSNAQAELANSIPQGTPRKLLVRLYRSYQYRQAMFPDAMLLNCYRLITNPECRQYILRQAFESCAIRHAMSDVEELFNPSMLIHAGTNITENIDAIDGWTFKERAKTFMAVTRELQNFEMTTTGLENTSKFLESLIYVYGYANWTYNIVPIYQMLNYVRLNNKLRPIERLLQMMLRDIITQTTFITYFLNTAFEENPGVLTSEFCERIEATFKKFHTNEVDLASTIANTDTEFKEATDTVFFFMRKFLNGVGISNPTTPHKDALWFHGLVDQLTPDVNTTGSAGGGTLGW